MPPSPKTKQKNYLCKSWLLKLFQVLELTGSHWQFLVWFKNWLRFPGRSSSDGFLPTGPVLCDLDRPKHNSDVFIHKFDYFNWREATLRLKNPSEPDLQGNQCQFLNRTRNCQWLPVSSKTVQNSLRLPIAGFLVIINLLEFAGLLADFGGLTFDFIAPEGLESNVSINTFSP